MTEAELAAMLAEVQETGQEALDRAGDDFFPAPGTYVLLLGLPTYNTYVGKSGKGKGKKAGFLTVPHEIVSGPDQPNGETSFKFSFFSTNPVHARYVKELVAVTTGAEVPKDYTTLVGTAVRCVEGKVVQAVCAQEASKDGAALYNNLKYTGLVED